jgi:hypothetical protein
MKFLNVEEALRQLNELKAVDLRMASLDELLQRLDQFHHHIGVIKTIPAGTVVSRTVSCKYLKGTASEIPIHVSQISFNPNAAICGFNRASWAGTTAFYGAISSEKLKSYNTGGFEVLTDLKVSENEVDRETFVVGKWIVKKDLNLVHVSGNLKHNAQQVAERYEAFYKTVSQHPEHIIPLKMVDSFLTAEYSKTVDKDAKWNYKISAAYAELVKRDNWPGILFPSVQADGAGDNVVLFPEHVDEYLQLERAALTTYFKRSDDIVNEYSMDALPNDNMLRWKESYNYRLPPAMKRWYTGQSDDDSFKKYIAFEEL